MFCLPNHYEKWYPAQTPISLIPVGKVTGITTKNLKYSLDNEELTIGYRTGSSNEVAEEGFVKISHKTGRSREAPKSENASYK